MCNSQSGLVVFVDVPNQVIVVKYSLSCFICHFVKFPIETETGPKTEKGGCLRLVVVFSIGSLSQQ